MVTVDLITGFLGAGKTTFIKKYLHYLQGKGLTVRIIENEFGDVSVDSQMLREEHCEIDDLSGLCMCCVGKDAFIKILQRSALSGCDRIIVEPSGIYDVEEFFEVLSLPNIAPYVEIGSILTIADPCGIEYLSDEARYLMFTQLLSSGMVLISKTQHHTPEAIESFLQHLDALMQEKGCSGVMADIMTKSWDDLDEDDFKDCMDAGYNRFVYERELFRHDEAFSFLTLFGRCLDPSDLSERVRRAFESPACGKIYRIKGYAKTPQGDLYEVNATPDNINIHPVSAGEDIIVIIGQQLRRNEIREIFKL